MERGEGGRGARRGYGGGGRGAAGGTGEADGVGGSFHLDVGYSISFLLHLCL